MHISNSILAAPVRDDSRPAIVLINMAKLVQKSSFSRSKIYELMNRKSAAFDSRFPTPVRAGRRILFVLHEVEAYLEAFIAAGRPDSGH